MIHSSAGQGDAATSLEALVQRIRNHEASRARDLDPLAAAVVAAEARLAVATASLATAGRKVADAAANHGSAAQALAQTPGTNTVVGLHAAPHLFEPDDTRVLLSRSVLTHARQQLMIAEQGVDVALAQLHVVRTTLVEAQRAHDTQLAALRAQRDGMLARFASVADDARTRGGQSTRAVDDWIRDLPVYGGQPEPAALKCRHCGKPLTPDRRRFCSKRCRLTHVELYGTGTHPRQSYDSDAADEFLARVDRGE